MVLAIVKIVSSALIIYVVTETAKRSNFLASVLISLPLVSLISLAWMLIEKKDAIQLAEFSWNVFWLTIPSLAMFIALPLLIKIKVNTVLAIVLSVLLTVGFYFMMIFMLKKFNVKI
jgi:hypothetical protein